MKNEIFDCHCHFVNKEDFELYKKTASATKFLNIRSTNESGLVKPYDFETFKGEDDMFFTESVDLYNIDSELARVEENLKANPKIVGIKIYLGYQKFYANSEEVEKVIKIAQKYGASMVFHCGEIYDPNNKSANNENYSDAKYIEDLAIKYKDVNFIGSHLNWPDFDNIFSLCEKYENVFTCISGCLDAIEKEKREEQISETAEILNKYLNKYPNLKNKLMYGTDFFSEDIAFINVSGYIKIVESLQLSKEENERILGTNILNAYKKILI